MAETKAQILREAQQRAAKAKAINKAAAVKRASGTASGSNKPEPIKPPSVKFAVPRPQPAGGNKTGQKKFTNKDL